MAGPAGAGAAIDPPPTWLQPRGASLVWYGALENGFVHSTVIVPCIPKVECIVCSGFRRLKRRVAYIHLLQQLSCYLKLMNWTLI